MNISLSSEDVSAFQKIYSEDTEIVEWMYRFGSPLEKIVSGLIKYEINGMNGVGLQVLTHLKTWNISITFLGV